MGFIQGIRRRLVERLGGTLVGDVGISGDVDPELRGTRAITERVKTRDLDLLSHEKMVNLGLYLYTSNSTGGFLVRTPVALTVGRDLGYSVSINVEMAQALGAKGAPTSPEAARKLEMEIRGWLDMYWKHAAHDICGGADLYGKTFLSTGHLVLPVTAVNPSSGVPQLDLIDAGQIKGVMPYAGSSMRPGSVVYTPAGTADEREVAVVRPNVSGALLPLEADGNGLSGCLYFANSLVLNSMRGVSHLLDVADWIDALDQGTWASLDRAKLRNAIVWHLKMQGAVDGTKITDEVRKVIAALGSPGNVYGSNENIELEAKASNIEAADTVELHRMILTYVLGAKGIPESWYSQGGNANRATAGEQTDVAYKMLADQQAAFRRIFTTLLHFGYDSIQAKQSRLPFRPDSPWLTLEPMLPLVQERDTSRAATSLVQLETSLEAAVDAEFISRQSAREVFLDVAGKLSGKPFELDQEVGRIDAEESERKARQEAAANALARSAFGGGPPDPTADPTADPPPAKGAAAA